MSLAHETWVTQLLRHLPAGLHGMLDRWAARRAQHRAALRREAWQRRKQAKAA